MNVPSIYKVHYLKNNETDSIYVFYGETSNINESDLYEKCFDSEELIKIRENHTPVFFVQSQIHRDDTILTIKTKILKECTKKNIVFSIPEMYLFCQKSEKLNTAEIYESLTRNKRVELSKNRFETFLLNLQPSIDVPSKKVYDYDDLLSLKLDQKPLEIDKILGQKYYFVDGEYPFVHNPYNVKENYDYLYEKTSRKSILGLNSYLLFNTGTEIVNNTIYLCLAKDVFKNAEEKGFSLEVTSKIYFPALYSQNIRDLSSLADKSQELLEGNKEALKRVNLESYKVVNMFYDIYKERKEELPYLSRGIRSMKIIIHPDFSVKMPLDVIFKLIHATEKNPLIKYNPALRQENLYRLYTDQISTEGQKIPFLNKAEIIKLTKTIGKTKTVAVYLEAKTNQNEPFSFICEFMENGDIVIISEFKKVIPEEIVDEMLQNSINPLLDDIRDFLQQNGYQIPAFHSLYDENVEIKYLNYELQVEIQNELNLSTLTCLSTIFIEEISETKGKKKTSVSAIKRENEVRTQLRFKRVANFNKTTSQEAFIIEKINDFGFNREEIILALLENYSEDLNQTEASELFARVVGELTVEKGKKKTDTKIKNNPGFKTIFSVIKKSAILTVTVENINDIHYLTTIPIFLDSVIRITQDKNSTRYPEKTIDHLCSLRIFKINEKKEVNDAREKNIQISNLVIKDRVPSEGNEEETIDEDLEQEKIQNAMDLFFGNDDDDEEEEDEDLEKEGGASKKKKNDDKNDTYNGITIPSELYYPDEDDDEDEIDNDEEKDKILEETNTNTAFKNTIKNIDGMSLNNPYFFQERISQRDPALILKADTGRYNSYSRTCLSSKKRQPVILTDDELKKINQEHPGFLRKEDIITYGSNPNKKFNYICPRYWCLKTNTVLDPKDFVKRTENGKEILVHPTCGKILPADAKRVIPGHYVYEFYKIQDKKDFKRFPGYQVDKHPDGYCLPCCFDLNTRKRLEAVTKCQAKSDDEGEKEKNGKKEKEDEYIIGMEKFPLSNGRWGYLPIPLQQFLNVSGQTCKSGSANPCFLRHGVETSSKQSFLACIADAYFYSTSSSKKPSIREFKKIMIENLSVDYFINYQNGNLVNDFYDVTIQPERIDEFINSPKSTQSKLYSLVYSPSHSLNKDAAILYYQKVACSFLNFIDFLKNDKIVIDHTYLWDMVTQPKSFLKDRNIPSKEIYYYGFNLVILEIPEDDITQNIEIICPTNHYTSEPFHPKLGTLILMKKDDFYEPIYSYLSISKDNNSIDRFFYRDTKSTNIKNVLNEIIYPLMNTICKPEESLPNRYFFQQAIPLSTLKESLKKMDISILKYVFNFNNKIIGIIVNNETNEIMVPCYPSSLDNPTKTLEKEKTVFMNDLTIWKSYEETVTSLLELNEKSDNQIPCKPLINVIEDELIVGILTETNQFIQINPPIQKIDVPRDIRLKISIQGNNMILADLQTTSNKEQDEERVEMIQKIRMESNFYNVFRNTIRILLNDYENVKKREELEGVLKNDSLLYLTKLQKITELLKDIVDDKILFIGDEKYSKLINEVSTCIVKNADKCSASNVCAIVEKEGKSICQLILPKKNLINQERNQDIYYRRMADELTRYTRIQNFMFQPQTYLSFGNNQVKYNLRDNEMILIESMITQEYFSRLIPMKMNPYVKNNSYDEVKPLIHPLYENEVNMETLSNIAKPGTMRKKTIILEEDKEKEPQREEIIEKVKTTTQEEEEQPILEIKEIEEEIEEKIQDKMNMINPCKDEVEKPIFDKKRNQLFPLDYKEFKYKNNNIDCSYDVITILLKIYNKEKTIYEIKEDLFESYQSYLPQFQTKILDLLKIEKKENLCNQVLQGTMTFENMIMNDAYFLSLFDLWILVQKYKLPTIFMCTYKLLETNQTSKIMVGYQRPESNEFTFIVTPPITKKTPINKPPINRFILTNTNEILIHTNLLNKETELYGELQKSIEYPKTIEDFLTKFTRND
jgi:hypothetical protein